VESVVVHPRIFEKHPEISEQDVLDAWHSCFRSRSRIDKNPHEYIAIGADRQGRLLELVAKCSVDGDWLIYHAMTPPSKKTLKELEA